jgi:hypothetical protein
MSNTFHPSLNGAVLLSGAPGVVTEWCNPYGAESDGITRTARKPSDQRFLGERGHKVFHQWSCQKRAVGHFRMICEHGHRGQMMPLCADHAGVFRKRQIEYCPRCNIPPGDHRCKITLTEIS